MKKNPSLIGLVATLAILAVCYLVYELFLEKKDSYLIANPSEESININIDNENYVIAPKQTTEIKLKPGEHKINFNFKGKTVDTTFSVKYYNGVINPTQSDYYVFTRPYGPGRNKDSIFTARTTTIDDRVFYGEIEHSNDLYIQGFYYNLDQNYPKFFLNKGQKTDISKIFSKDDFKQFYFENYE